MPRTRQGLPTAHPAERPLRRARPGTGLALPERPDSPEIRPTALFVFAATVGEHGAAPFISRGLSQAGSVFGDRPNLALGHVRSDASHGRVGVVGAPALLERLQLRDGVLGELAGDARILRRNAGAGRSMAAGAGRHAR